MSVNNDNGDAEHRMSITKGHGHGHSMVGSAFFLVSMQNLFALCAV